MTDMITPISNKKYKAVEDQRKTDPKLQIVRGHKHTCTNVQIGSTYEDKCDCGALDTAGKAIPDHSGEISTLLAEIEKLRRCQRD